MRSYFNQEKYSVSYNQAFESVITACATHDRPKQMGTWINEGIIDAYIALHELGYAHSVEVWRDEELVGGLYGIGLGDIFFGESMFANASNASKFGFISLCRKLDEIGIKLVDCQQETNHLMSMGAELMSKEEFWKYISVNQAIADRPIRLND
jgi:leucyl/phenylalanyl-tRNA--protein transferase